MWRLSVLFAVHVAVVCAGCRTSVEPAAAPTHPPRVLSAEQGFASYYGRGFQRRRTASGVIYEANALVAAHPRYPFGTLVHVTNLRNGRGVDVRVVDRGPGPAPRRRGAIIDLSYRAARELGMLRQGRARVRVEVLRWGTVNPS